MHVARALLALAFATVHSTASAHGGGLDADGCHTNRKTGDYHCHRASAPARRAPSREPMPFAGEQRAVIVSTDRAFKNCTEAREAGAAPVRRGQPGYGPHLDRDNDGVACE